MQKQKTSLQCSTHLELNPQLAPSNQTQPPHQLSKNVITNPNALFIDQPNIKVFCHDCRKQINNVVSILSNSIYRCVGCFAKQQPSQQPYKVLKNLDFCLIDPDWKAKHQLLFLNFLQKFGFGNWQQIQEQMSFFGADYTQQELQNHYNHFYLVSQDCLPNISNNEHQFQKQNIQLQKSRGSNELRKPPINTVNTTSKIPYEQIDQFYQNHYISNNQPNSIEGYNSKRRQFQIEFDQNAQNLIANLQFRQDDSPQETHIKFQFIQQYNRRLQTRNTLKEFVLQHRLLDQNYQQEMNKNRNSYQKQAFELLKPIARLTNLKEYNQLVRKFAFTKQLRCIIQGLRMFRRTHPSNYRNLHQFLNTQLEEGKPKKRKPSSSSTKIQKKVDRILQKQFSLSRHDLQGVVQKLRVDKNVYYRNNIQIELLQKEQ